LKQPSLYRVLDQPGDLISIFATFFSPFFFHFPPPSAY
jgi:hypothetical protein